MDVYYHYTTPEAAVSIVKSGVIKMSTKKAKRRDDARYGVGVYLTQVPPTTPRVLIAFNNYDGNEATLKRIIQSGKQCRCNVKYIPPVMGKILLVKYLKYFTKYSGKKVFKIVFLQRVSIACYAERCISYDRFCPTV